MELVTAFKALADETRLRLLHLLSMRELSVNEIVNFMGMGQSRISRHLKILFQAGFVCCRRDGLWVFYRICDEDRMAEFIKELKVFFKEDSLLLADEKRLKIFIEEQRDKNRRFFDGLAVDWDNVKHNIIGTFDFFSKIDASFLKDKTVADLGCGTGSLLAQIAPLARSLIGVDRSTRMLEQAEKRFDSEGFNADLRIGELEHLPMRESEIEVALINMVLHHLVDPSRVINEVFRVLHPGGLVLIADLVKHHNEEFRDQYGHRWLGFNSHELESWLELAGFSSPVIDYYENGRICLVKAEKPLL